MVWTTVFAFIALCCMSSAGYIINDLKDIKRDRAHPEKRNRPLASRKISTGLALTIMLVLIIISLAISFSIGLFFMYSVISLFILTLIYTFILKHVVLADVLTIATLFVIRAVSGAFAIDVIISPWLVLVPFFLSLFLSVGKRHADVIMLKGKAKETRETLKTYTKELTNSLMTISTTLLVISYALYSFQSEYNTLLYTLPFALFLIFRFFYLINSGSDIARHPERVIKDKAMVIGMIVWLAVTVLSIYL